MLQTGPAEDFPESWTPRPVVAEDLVPQPWAAPPELERELVDRCSRKGVPVWIAARNLSRESTADGQPTNPHWNTWAVSPVGALGAAQLMPGNLDNPLFISFNDGQPIDPFNVHHAIRVEVGYLAWLHVNVGTWGDAVAAYNCGPGRWALGNLPPETVTHRRLVMGAADRRT